MSRAEFVHLHLHTEYSLLDGACRLDRLMERAAELEFPALAITDHGVLYGAIDFYQAARQAGIRPIIGCEVRRARQPPGEKSAPGGRDVYHHLVLLARDLAGYRNLVRLVTAAHLEGHYYKPRIDKELLAAHREGLLALSGCLASEIPTLIAAGQMDRARDTIDWFKQVLGPENFALELQHHGLPDQATVNRQLIPWAKEFGLRLVATNDVHYVRREHSHAHDCLICIGTQTTLEDPKRLRYVPEQFYLRSAEEMAAQFAEVPEAVRNTLAVAEQCHLELEFGRLHYPAFHPPEPFSREAYLRHLLAEGLQRRYGLEARAEGDRFVIDGGLPAPGAGSAGGGSAGGLALPDGSAGGLALPDGSAGGLALPPGSGGGPALPLDVQVILDRLDLELRVIEKTGFISYFLIVGDFVRHGRRIGVSCVARGSAAGSLVTYLLEISNVDPIRYGLLFERFLNPERVNPPDIDIDFADDRRADVIAYVREKYGRDSVAQIITFGTLGAKSVVRDVGRVMGLDYAACDRLARMIPNDLSMDLQKALQASPEFCEACAREPQTRELVDTALVLEDLTRTASVHAAGVVIGDQPLVNLLPLKQDDEGALVTQYAMGPVGDLGLLKVDFLGLKTLTVLRNTVELVKQTTGRELDVERLPLDDPPTYALLNNAQTLGVFQLESGGMRDLCRKFQIESIEHITALISLYRPGPMDLIPDFIERRHGRTPIEYAHPLLEPISRETYGVLIYQEQVMQAAQVLAGYTLGGADLLRRAMGKKKLEEMARQRELFVRGCAERNQIPPREANPIFDLLEKFAGYGFNKSHAAAYALVAYQTAYLKANHPVEFFCAMMTNDMADTDRLAGYVAEARGLGIEVLPPEVNVSGLHFGPERASGPDRPGAPGAIRFGLAAIKGVGEAAVQILLDARAAGGPFTSLLDLCGRVDNRAVNRRMLECLIKCGACDPLGATRAALLAGLEAALTRGAAAAADRARGQGSLFGAFDVADAPARDGQAVLPELPLHERLAAEKELLGFYVTGHPLQPMAGILERYNLATTRTLPQLPNRTVTRLGGLIADVQKGVSRKTSKPYAVLTLEDLEGTAQLLCVNDAYERHREFFAVGRAVFVIGEVNTGDDRPKLFPQEFLPLEDAPKRFTRQVHVRLNHERVTPGLLSALRDLVAAHPGRCPLFLCVRCPGGEAVYIESDRRFGVTPSLELEQAVDALCGPNTWYARPDPVLPERPKRPWESKAEMVA